MCFILTFFKSERELKLFKDSQIISSSLFKDILYVIALTSKRDNLSKFCTKKLMLETSFLISLKKRIFTLLSILSLVTLSNMIVIAVRGVFN
ncbi:unknown [Clostridium sp. CAG:1193]|nr:unknown [Clostridium sp. CAG:1193]